MGEHGRTRASVAARGPTWTSVVRRDCRASAIESTSRRVGEGNGALSNGPRVSEAVVVSDHVRLC